MENSINHLEDNQDLKQSDTLLNMWTNILDSTRNYSNKIIVDCFFSIRVKLMIKVLNQISKENRLSKYDEKIFEYFRKLMWYYEQTISLYEQDKDNITNLKIKEIMEGIYTVLSSQLKQFEENQQYEYINSSQRNIKNPIRIEKDEIIVKAKNFVLEIVANLLGEYIRAKGEICFKYIISELTNSTNSHNSYIEILQNIYYGIIDIDYKNLYKAYCYITKGSIEKINNLQFRKAADFYYESIKQEREILETIMTVQVNALADELKHTELEVIEQQQINQILDTLIEAYQHLKREIESLEIYFKESENKTKEIKLMNLDEFKQYIIDEGAKKYIDDLIPKQFPNDIAKLDNLIINSKSNFETKFNEYIKQIIDYKIVCINKNYNISNEINDFAIQKSNMIDEFINCFKIIKDYCDLNLENLNQTQYNEILNGIYETLQIKLESLEESKQLFLNSINSIKDNLKFGLSDKLKNNIVKENLDYWFKECPLTEQSFIFTIESLYNNIENSEILLKYVSGLKRQKQSQQDSLNKKYIQFLKEHLLFELTTYEEILNYSVSKIREETELDVVKGFIKTIDDINLEIENLLIKYSIFTIKPKPYDIFNGKEHEVLMAEKHDNFEKGQIVKLMNTGYKYNNSVIIRANVIAAK